MNFSRLSGAILTLTFLAISANANPSTLYTLSYNFAVDNATGNPTVAGGGAAAQLNGNNIEIFCVDFAHTIWVPYGPPTYPGYTVNLSNLTNGSDLSLTRFGGVSSWTSVAIAGDAADSTIINNATTALDRYQMAAYLVTQYHTLDTPTDDAYNEGIQAAIWTLMDPAGYPTALPSNIGNPAPELQAAAQWFASSTNDKSFLTNFQIVSDTAMYNCGAGALCGGFQEQLFDPVMPAVPEPRGQMLVLLGVLSLCAFKYQRSLKRS